MSLKTPELESDPEPETGKGLLFVNTLSLQAAADSDQFFGVSVGGPGSRPGILVKVLQVAQVSIRRTKEFKMSLIQQLLFTFLISVLASVVRAETKVLVGENYTISYGVEGTRDDDIRIAKESIENGFVCLKELYSHLEPEQVIGSTNLKLILLSEKTVDVHEGAASTLSGTRDGRLSTYFADVQMLNFSAYQKPDYTLLGAPYNATYFYRTFVHEFAGPFFDFIARKRGGWGFYTAPDWFIQGLEEFTSSMCLGSPANNEILSKYRLLAKSYFAQNNQNPYVLGVSKITFFAVKFGIDRLNFLMASNKVSFEKAFEDITGETLENFEADWMIWLQVDG